ncbi:MAG: asparagine synthase (glutamine-hydrolyzing), partial [Gammaproteobacteria bacterium]|nr:asparagine synthase (glutamine-hydrolyzing) [Gammaproteobacteria bacterium]
GLGHRRLSIVDVAHGQQPMHSADQRFVIVYNGEVFNHPSLRPELEATGVRYRTRSDTETVLHLYQRFGERAVEHMRGMFAFAIWDSVERRLFLARDRYGVKPLYYVHRPDGTLIFGSEIKALLPALEARQLLNRQALPDFLANHAPSGEATLFEGIMRLPPAHTLIWQDGRISLRRYWDLKFADALPAPPPGSAAERAIVREYRERFTEAVRLRLMSDVPLGMFLSGGIDSAAITATMAGLVKEPIRTFSVGFAEREANELEYARLVSTAFHTEHREVVITPEEFFGVLPRLVWHEDEPIAHPSSVALYFVSRLAARDVKVVLTGEGSDETLAGYTRYPVTAYNARLGALYRRVLPEFARRGLRSLLESLPATSGVRQRAARTFLTRGADLDELYFDNFAVFSRAAQHDILLPGLRAELAAVDPYAAYHRALARVAGKPLVSQLLYADAKTYLHELLMKQDQMSMAASIESRVPFLDHPLTEWVASLPQAMKLRGATTKWILREAMAGTLPDPVLARRKMGFPVPVGRWLRGAWRPLLEEYVTGPRPRDRGLFEPGAIERLVGEHLRGVNHSERLWALLTFEIWARVFLDGEAPGSLALPLRRAA